MMAADAAAAGVVVGEVAVAAGGGCSCCLLYDGCLFSITMPKWPHFNTETLKR